MQILPGRLSAFAAAPQPMPAAPFLLVACTLPPLMVIVNPLLLFSRVPMPAPAPVILLSPPTAVTSPPLMVTMPAMLFLGLLAF